MIDCGDLTYAELVRRLRVKGAVDDDQRVAADVIEKLIATSAKSDLQLHYARDFRRF